MRPRPCIAAPPACAAWRAANRRGVTENAPSGARCDVDRKAVRTWTSPAHAKKTGRHRGKGDLRWGNDLPYNFDAAAYLRILSLAINGSSNLACAFRPAH